MLGQGQGSTTCIFYSMLKLWEKKKKIFLWLENIFSVRFVMLHSIFNNIWEYHLNKYISNSSKKKWCEYACFHIYFNVYY